MLSMRLNLSFNSCSVAWSWLFSFEEAQITAHSRRFAPVAARARDRHFTASV